MSRIGSIPCSFSESLAPRFRTLSSFSEWGCPLATFILLWEVEEGGLAPAAYGGPSVERRGLLSRPVGGWAALRQTFIILACHVAHDISRAPAQGREAVAMANGVFFMNLEKALGIWWEPGVQRRLMPIGSPMARFRTPSASHSANEPSQQ